MRHLPLRTVMADSDGFDLSQASDPTPDEQKTDLCCRWTSDTVNKCFPFDNTLRISRSLRMQPVVNLVGAAGRLRSPLLRLVDTQLCSTPFESVIEEQSNKKLQSNRAKKVYRRASSETQCTLSDIDQKDLVHGPGEMKLHAVTLKGGNHEQKAKFQMYRYTFPEDSNAQPVTLSIKDSNLYLTCCMQEGKAVLWLERCAVSLLQRISADNNMDRFLFNSSSTGEMTKFESVRCPGWYIGTSSEAEDQPVEMCQADNAATHLTDYNMEVEPKK